VTFSIPVPVRSVSSCEENPLKCATGVHKTGPKALHAPEAATGERAGDSYGGRDGRQARVEMAPSARTVDARSVHYRMRLKCRGRSFFNRSAKGAVHDGSHGFHQGRVHRRHRMDR
jgi:hypothetical protein